MKIELRIIHINEKNKEHVIFKNDITNQIDEISRNIFNHFLPLKDFIESTPASYLIKNENK